MNSTIEHKHILYKIWKIVKKWLLNEFFLLPLILFCSTVFTNIGHLAIYNPVFWLVMVSTVIINYILYLFFNKKIKNITKLIFIHILLVYSTILSMMYAFYIKNLNNGIYSKNEEVLKKFGYKIITIEQLDKLDIPIYLTLYQQIYILFAMILFLFVSMYYAYYIFEIFNKKFNID